MFPGGASFSVWQRSVRHATKGCVRVTNTVEKELASFNGSRSRAITIATNARHGARVCYSVWWSTDIELGPKYTNNVSTDLYSWVLKDSAVLRDAKLVVSSADPVGPIVRYNTDAAKLNELTKRTNRDVASLAHSSHAHFASLHLTQWQRISS
jgi:hypothetical protein